MAPPRKRRTRVTKEDIIQIRESNKIKGKKNKIIPGPWTNLTTDLVVEVQLRWQENFIGRRLRGSFKEDDYWAEKSWYPIVINIVSPNMKEEVAKHGMANYLAACEKNLNDDSEKLKDHGHIILLQATVDGSQREDPLKRFISCHAKTNRKHITGFSAMRTPIGGGKRKYVILGTEEVLDDDTNDLPVAGSEEDVQGEADIC